MDGLHAMTSRALSRVRSCISCTHHLLDSKFPSPRRITFALDSPALGPGRLLPPSLDPHLLQQQQPPSRSASIGAFSGLQSLLQEHEIPSKMELLRMASSPCSNASLSFSDKPAILEVSVSPAAEGGYPALSTDPLSPPPSSPVS